MSDQSLICRLLRRRLAATTPVATEAPATAEPFWHTVSDRKSTRLNSSHANISYAVFCLKKKRKRQNSRRVNSSAILVVVYGDYIRDAAGTGISSLLLYDCRGARQCKLSAVQVVGYEVQ